MAGQQRAARPSPTATRPIRGRENERRALLHLVEAAEAGHSGVLLVDGEPGSGKSLLLDEAARTAAAHGLPCTAGPVPPGRRGPALVSLDDLQWADPATLGALSRPGHRPLAWLLARRTAPCSDAAGRLFDLMEHHGAGRCVLAPLGEDAMTEIVIDVLGARPDTGLTDLVAGAGGNPALLTDLLTGLLDEGRIRIAGGRARLSSVRLPVRLRVTVRRRLDDLAPRTRRLLAVAAVLGRSFAVEDAAEILGSTPGAILPELDEALSAGILDAAPDTLCFRHDLVRRAAADAVPAPVRRALHRQAGELLIRRRGSAEAAASHLVMGASAGDARGLAGLDRAVGEVCPEAAADLAVRALELTAGDDTDRHARTVTAVRALAAAGRADEAESLARSAFSAPMPPVPCARLRCLLSEILRVRGRPREAVAEAEAALAEPRLPGAFRDDAALALLTARTGAGQDTRARDQAAAIVSAASDHGNALVTTALTVLALAEWDAGRLATGIGLAREAVRRATSVSAGPRMTLAMLLADVQLRDEARTLLASAGEPGGHTAALPAGLRARLALAEGRFGDALAEPADPTLLALAALRSGDLDTAHRHVARPPGGPAYACAGFALVAAQVAEARGGRVRLRPLCEEALGHAGALVRDPAAAAWLTRTALALDDRTRAHTVVTAAERLARDNPCFPSLGVAALHARGLFDQDARALEHAASEHAEPWARASAAEDLAALAASPARAVEILDRALTGYDTIGAARDAARVRRRLRRLGVRRRHWSRADRPVSGLASLTETERGISELVAQGLTNRQIADRLFMSVHTVAFHLRHVFRKLEVGSRVELTRLMLQRTA